MTPVFFKNEATKDLKDAISWYENKRKGLGKGFRESFEEVLERIAQNPYRYAAIHEDVRCGRLKRFPYGLFYYVVRDQAVIVIAISHHARDSGHWKSRVKSHKPQES